MNRLIWIAPAILVLLGGCGSKSDPASRDPDEFDATKTPPAGCGTDENWRTFQDRESTNQVTVDDTQAPFFVAPVANGASVPSSPKPTLAWQPTPTDTGAPLGRATCSECPACGTLGTEHLPPVSGDVFDVHFSVGGNEVYRIVYTSQRFTPPDSLWASWKGQTVSITSYRMALKTNDVLAGPFRAASPSVFTVGQ